MSIRARSYFGTSPGWAGCSSVPALPWRVAIGAAQARTNARVTCGLNDGNRISERRRRYGAAPRNPPPQDCWVISGGGIGGLAGQGTLGIALLVCYVAWF